MENKKFINILKKFIKQKNKLKCNIKLFGDIHGKIIYKDQFLSSVKTHKPKMVFLEMLPEGPLKLENEKKK